MTVVVGGASRKAGKTTVICEIIAATLEARWTAIKITPHTHEPSVFGDTGRYLAAGAVRALLLPHYSAGDCDGNVILESNRIMETLLPDLFVFVDGGGEWKPSAVRHASKAKFIERGHASPELIAHISAGVHL